MRLRVGPFDSAPRRWEAAVGRFYARLALAPVTDAVDRAFQAGERQFATFVAQARGQLEAASRG